MPMDELTCFAYLGGGVGTLALLVLLRRPLGLLLRVLLRGGALLGLLALCRRLLPPAALLPGLNWVNGLVLGLLGLPGFGLLLLLNRLLT